MAIWCLKRKSPRIRFYPGRYFGNPCKKQCPKISSKNKFYIRLPKKIGLFKEKERRLLFDAVKKMYWKAKNSSKIYIDFSETLKIYPEGMIYLYAEILNIQTIYNVSIKCKKSHNAKTNHILFQIGIFDICNYPFHSQKEYKNIVYWKKTSGSCVDGSKFDDIIDSDDRIFKHPLGINIYGGFIEAIKNACIHAYIEARELSPVNNAETAWWVFSQLKENYVYIAVCDLGIGIPKTVFLRLSIPNDADIIKAAIEKPSSRTKKYYRGNGLKTIADIAKQDIRASFSIYSCKGHVYSLEGMLRTINFKTSLPGTIVAWKLPLTDTPK